MRRKRSFLKLPITQRRTMSSIETVELQTRNQFVVDVARKIRIATGENNEPTMIYI